MDLLPTFAMGDSNSEKLYAASIKCERFLVWIHCTFMGVARMNWLYEHTEVITVAAIFIVPLLMFCAIVLLASGKTPEVEDLQGAPETLGDFPPLPPMQLSKEFQNVSIEDLERILDGD